MAIRIMCPECHHILSAQDSYLHKKIRCPNCKTKFIAEPVEEEQSEGEQGYAVLTPIDKKPSRRSKREATRRPVKSRKRQVTHDEDNYVVLRPVEEDEEVSSRNIKRQSAPRRSRIGRQIADDKHQETLQLYGSTRKPSAKLGLVIINVVIAVIVLCLIGAATGAQPRATVGTLIDAFIVYVIISAVVSSIYWRRFHKKKLKEYLKNRDSRYHR